MNNKIGKVCYKYRIMQFSYFSKICRGSKLLNEEIMNFNLHYYNALITIPYIKLINYKQLRPSYCCAILLIICNFSTIYLIP